jgi:predicted DNA-binding transcriptional regulator AlpA
VSEPARTLVSLPSVSDLLDRPELAYDMPVDAARKLMLSCASLMEALRVAASSRVAATDHSGDDLLDARGVAAELGVSRSWIEHNLHRLPEPKLIGSRKRWRRADIRVWKRTI